MTRLACAAQQERDRNQYRHDMFMAWHAAAFGRIKRLPALAKAMRLIEPAEGKAVKKQSPQEILQHVEMITAMFGGKDKRRKTKRDKKKDH